jgi:hypothetical protein
MRSKYPMLKVAFLLCLHFGDAFTLLGQPRGEFSPKLQTHRLWSSGDSPDSGVAPPPHEGPTDGSVGQQSSDLWLPNAPTASESMVRSVNYFISRACNYSCDFCFHTMKNTNKLSLDEAKRGLKMLRAAGTEKVRTKFMK